jgi:hypothetical protein
MIIDSSARVRVTGFSLTRAAASGTASVQVQVARWHCQPECVTAAGEAGAGRRDRAAAP